jgi:hypothetical protein
VQGISYVRCQQQLQAQAAKTNSDVRGRQEMNTATAAGAAPQSSLSRLPLLQPLRWLPLLLLCEAALTWLV